MDITSATCSVRRVRNRTTSLGVATRSLIRPRLVRKNFMVALSKLSQRTI
jgi:hypothetical protein